MNKKEAKKILDKFFPQHFFNPYITKNELELLVSLLKKEKKLSNTDLAYKDKKMFDILQRFCRIVDMKAGNLFQTIKNKYGFPEYVVFLEYNGYRFVHRILIGQGSDLSLWESDKSSKQDKKWNKNGYYKIENSFISSKKPKSTQKV